MQLKGDALGHLDWYVEPHILDANVNVRPLVRGIGVDVGGEIHLRQQSAVGNMVHGVGFEGCGWS